MRRQAALLRVVTLVIALLIAIPSAHAQQGEDLREAAQNPIADLISLPFQNNTNFDIGHTDNTQNVLNIQPVYPGFDPACLHKSVRDLGYLTEDDEMCQ